ncbi:hypothetical protein ACVRYP_04020 [Streptococcus rifensis]
MMSEVLAALVGALVAALVTYVISNRDLSDSLDSKSGWREKLFTVASKYELTLDDAQTVRTALRIFPKFEEVEQYSFSWFSDIMIVHLDRYILNKDFKDKVTEKISKKKSVQIKNLQLITIEDVPNSESNLLDSDTTAIVRLFAMFLLKHHFDYRSSMGAKDYLYKLGRDKNKIYNPIVEETYDNYLKLMRRIDMCEDTDKKDEGKETEGKNGDKTPERIGCLVGSVVFFVLTIILLLLLFDFLGKGQNGIRFINLEWSDLGISKLLLIPLFLFALLFIFSMPISILSGLVISQKLTSRPVSKSDHNIVELKDLWEKIYEK